MNSELQRALETLATDIKTKTASHMEPLENNMKTMQSHLDHLDMKMQSVSSGVSGGMMKVDEVKGLITKNHDKIDDLQRGVGAGIQVKAAGNMTLLANLTGDQNREYQDTVSMVPGAPIHFSQLIRTIPISVGTFTYPREIGSEGVFGTPVEGEEKNQIDYDIEMIDVSTDFLAGYCRFSKKMSNNLPYLEQFLPQALRRDYYKAEDLKFYTELTAVITASTLTTGSEIERIMTDATNLMMSNFFPTVVVVNPFLYGRLLLSAGPSGTGTEYSLPGVVTVSNGVVSINGIMVVVANWVGQTEYIIGDWSYAQKIQTEGLTLGFFYEDADNVTRNLCTCRLESQVALCIQNPQAWIFGDTTTVA